MTPVTSPSTNQSCARAAHALLGRLPPPTHTLTWPVTAAETHRGAEDFLSTSCPGFLAWRPAVKCCCVLHHSQVSFGTPRLESAKGLVSPRGCCPYPRQAPLGTPEQRRTSCSILVLGRRICQGKGVDWFYLIALLAQIVPF